MTIIRSATSSAGDVQVVREMSYRAIAWRDRIDEVAPAVVDALLARPEFRVYMAGWARPTDRAVIAEADGAAVGAAWYRFFADDDHGYGFIDARTPEVGVAVRPSFRRRGIGGAVVRALVDCAGADGVAALSLSVERDNPAAGLYRRLGFVTVGQNGDAWTMRLDLKSC